MATKGDTLEDPEKVKKFREYYTKKRIKSEDDVANAKLTKEKATQLASDPKGNRKGERDDKEDKPDNPEDLHNFKEEYLEIKLTMNVDMANVKIIKDKALQMARDPKKR